MPDSNYNFPINSNKCTFPKYRFLTETFFKCSALLSTVSFRLLEFKTEKKIELSCKAKEKEMHI